MLTHPMAVNFHKKKFTMNILTYNEQQINQREDGYVNGTQMAKANNVLIADWLRLKATTAYIEALSHNMGIPINSTVTVQKEGFPAKKTTWLHPLAAIAFGQWISPQFHVWCNRHIKTLIETGKTELQPQFDIPKTYAEALRLAADQSEKIERLESQITKDAPKVALAEAISFSDTSVSMNEYAKMIDTGRTRLFIQLRECGVVMQNSTLPYQRWIEAGYFEVSQEILGNGKLIPFALVTGKGQIWLKQKLDEHKRIESAISASCHSVIAKSMIQSVLNFEAEA